MNDDETSETTDLSEQNTAAKNTAAKNTAAKNTERPRWDPLGELEAWLGGGGGRSLSWPNPWSIVDDIDFTPAAVLAESDDAWTIDLELAGVAKDDIDVEVRGRTVVIRGERKEKTQEGVVRQRRRTYGQFRYELTLPGDLDAESITATLDNGELMVRVPKSEAEQPRKIEIS